MRPVRSPTRSTSGLVHLPTAAEQIQLSEEDGLPAGHQLLGPPPLVEEGAAQVGGAVEHVDLDQGPALARPPGAHPLHVSENHGLLAHLQVLDRDLLGAVDVPAGIVGDEVEHRRDAHLLQRLGLGGPDAGQIRHRTLGECAQLQAPTRVPPLHQSMLNR